MKKGIVFTCITGNYDSLIDHKYINPDWDYVCFTDDLSIRNDKNKSWKLKKLVFTKLDDARNQRWHKLHPHILFPQYEYSLYVDGNVIIRSRKFFNLIYDLTKKNIKIAIGLHPERNSLYEEAEECIRIGKDLKEVIEKQIKIIKKDKFPKDFGMFENNVMLRKHNDRQIIKLMTDWWWWIENYSRRDQLSLTYVAWKNKVKIYPLYHTPLRKTNLIELIYDPMHVSKEELIKQKDYLLKETQRYEKELRRKILEIHKKNQEVQKKDEEISKMLPDYKEFQAFKNGLIWKVLSLYRYLRKKFLMLKNSRSMKLQSCEFFSKNQKYKTLIDFQELDFSITDELVKNSSLSILIILNKKNILSEFQKTLNSIRNHAMSNIKIYLSIPDNL